MSNHPAERRVSIIPMKDETATLSHLAIQSDGSEPGAAAKGAGFSRTAAAVGVEGTRGSNEPAIRRSRVDDEHGDRVGHYAKQILNLDAAHCGPHKHTRARIHPRRTYAFARTHTDNT